MRNREPATRDVILAIAANNKDGKIEGRTLLQKLVYFLNELNDLHIPFEKAYYGPYSEAVAKSTNSLVTLGFLAETETLYPAAAGNVFPVCKYKYTLTPEGREVFESVVEKDRDFFERLRNALSRITDVGEIDYVSLSLAAKMYHILKTEHPKSMKKHQIMSVAHELNWQLSEESIESAAAFLIDLGLVKEVVHKDK